MNKKQKWDIQVERINNFHIIPYANIDSVTASDYDVPIFGLLTLNVDSPAIYLILYKYIISTFLVSYLRRRIYYSYQFPVYIVEIYYPFVNFKTLIYYN